MELDEKHEAATKKKMGVSQPTGSGVLQNRNQRGVACEIAEQSVANPTLNEEVKGGCG